MTYTATLTGKGQVTNPNAVRVALQLKRADQLAMRVLDDDHFAGRLVKGERLFGRRR
jgi:bifunctional DNA-binding transcriptional regulator/antitoxin component of YhaV-PrlF toxin-antitoxin module